jgi:membrane-associated protease RseP (regulator of RpoE activity)
MTDLDRDVPGEAGSLPPPSRWTTRRPIPPPPPPPPPPAESERGAWVRLALPLAALFALGIFGSWWAFAFVVALIVCVFLHELGHFVMARRAGMKVTEFFLGFGPRIWSFRRGEVEYGVKAIPAGAYVRIIGMTNLEEVPPEDEPRTYRQKGYWSRLSVAVAGSAMHFLIAIVLLVVVIGGFGIQRDTAWKVSQVSTNSPALAAGVQSGDRITAIDGVPVSTFAELTTQIRSRPGQTVDLTVQRPNGTIQQVSATLAATNPENEPVGFLGIGEGRDYVRDAPPVAVASAVKEFGRISWDSVVGLSKVFSPNGVRNYIDQLTNKPATSGNGPAASNPDSTRLVTPIGVARLHPNSVADFLLLLAVVNISIGLFNLFPVLPFDGGHVVIATYEAIRSRKGRRYHADIRKMFPVSYAIMGLFLFFVVGSLWLDIVRPVGG